MSLEEIIYDGTSDNCEQSATNPEIGSFLMSLRSDEQENKIPSNQPTFTDNILTTSDENNEILLCALWQSGYLGAAYYSVQESELYVLCDIIDLKPDFILTKNLYNQIKPSHTITLGTMASKFVCALSQITLKSDLNEDTSSVLESVTNLPPNVQLLKKINYSFELCVHAVNNLKLSSEPPDLTDLERKIYIKTLVNFDKRVSLQALGALIIFLQKTCGLILKENNNGELLFLNINTITINDLVLMNSDSFKSLKIFDTVKQRPGSKSNIVEGNSIFKLFNRCKSKIGQANLRNLLLCPTNNIGTLKKRHQFIEFCLKPVNQGIVSTIQECLSNIFSLATAFNKIQGNQSTINNWKTLYTTLYNISCVKQICQPHVQKVEIFLDFVNKVCDIVDNTLKTIQDTIDFEDSEHRKISVKIGIDKTLDQKKRYKSEIKERITLAASYEIENLPDYIKLCSIVYIPEIGYVVAIKPWAVNATPSDIEQYGYRQIFTIDEVMYFKSAVCDELDTCLGDIHSEIEDLENKIISNLSKTVIKHSAILKKLVQTIALFDSLISMTEVAKQLSYICPNLVLENVIKIENGRHPLIDLSVNDFVPNSFLSGADNPVMKIITGPNNSGKSIYLKQNALIVYLAHIGSFVPAKSATIGMMYSIHTNICGSRDAECLALSTFAVNLLQISQSMNTSKYNSLILIDEFGRATTEIDGLAILTSYLEHYSLREEFCPHVVVSTHHLQLTNLIPESKLVEHLKCDFKLIDNKIIFLYNIVKGISKSFAKYAARQAMIPERFIQRFDEILKCYQEGTLLKPVSK